MAFFGDYHTHSQYSHGAGTIEDNVKAAINAGLKQVAITDHGFKHLLYNVTRKEFDKKERIDVEELRLKYKEIDILLGLETNFNSVNGNVDLKPKDTPGLDVIVCGYHKFVMPYHVRDFFTFFMPNFWLDTFHLTSKRIKKRNTEAYVQAIERFDIDIIAHINYGISVDVKAVAEACAHYGTKVELNGKRINMSDEELEIAANAGVEFICNSDAHAPENVGNFAKGLKVIERIGIPYSQVCNWERFPLFRSRIKHGGIFKVNCGEKADND